MADHSAAHRWLAGTAAVLALLALPAGDPYPAERDPARRDAAFVTPIDAARLIREGRPDVRIIDLRPDSLFAAYHVPGAEQMDDSVFQRHSWLPEDNVILYAEDDARAIRAAAALRRRGVKRVAVLRGGLLAWVDQIVQPRLDPLRATATVEEHAVRREHLELSRYFGGTPYVSPGIGRRTDGASEAAAVARIMRRGC